MASVTVVEPQESPLAKRSITLPPEFPAGTLVNCSTHMSHDMGQPRTKIRGRGVKISRWPCVEPLYGETYLGTLRHLRNMLEHYKRIDSVVGLTDCSSPRTHENLRVKLKRLMLEGERLAKQEWLNKKMMGEILRVMKGPGVVVHYHDRKMTGQINSLNYVERRLTVNRINMENKLMLKRILETSTCYDHIQMELDYQKKFRQILPKSAVFKLWNKLRKQRRRNIIYGEVQRHDIPDPDEVRERFLAAHRQCFPSWPQPVRPQPLPRSSSPRPDQRPVDHRRCFVPPVLIPPLRHYRLGAVPVQKEGVEVTIPENKAQLLRSQCIHEKLEAMKPKPLHKKSTRPLKGVKFKVPQPAAGDAARRNENQSNVELPPIAISSAGSVSAKSRSRSSRSSAKSPDSLVPLSVSSRSPRSPDAEADDELRMKETKVPRAQAITEEVSPERQRSTSSMNINNSKSAASPCVSSMNQAFDGRHLRPCAEDLPLKLPSVVEGKPKQASSERPLHKPPTPTAPLRLPPVRVPSNDNKGTTSPSSAESCGNASISKKLRALVLSKHRDQRKKSDASALDLLTADAADLPDTRHRRTKRPKGSVRSKSDLSVREGARSATTRQKARSSSRRNVHASSSTGLRRSSGQRDERLSKSTKQEGRNKFAKHSSRPRSRSHHKLQAVHSQNSKAAMTEEVSFLPKESKEKSSESRKSRQKRPKASGSVSRKSRKKDQNSSTLVSDKAPPERQVPTPSAGHQRGDSHHLVDKRQSISRNRHSDRSKDTCQESTEKNSDSKSATMNKHVKTKSSVKSHPADRSNNMGSFLEKCNQPKEIVISPPSKRRNMEKNPLTASHPAKKTQHACQRFDYHDVTSPDKCNSNNNTSTGGFPSKCGSDNTDCNAAAASSSGSASPESLPSPQPQAGQKLGAAPPPSFPNYGSSVDHVSQTQECFPEAFGTAVDSPQTLETAKTHKTQPVLASPAEKAAERAAQAESDDPLHGVDFLSTGDFPGKEGSPRNLRQETGRALDDFEAGPTKPTIAIRINVRSCSGDGNFASGENGDVASPELDPQLPTPKRKHGLLRLSPMRAQVLRSFAEAVEEGDRTETQCGPTPATKEQVHQKAPDEEVEEEEGLKQGEDDEKDEIDEEIKTSRDFEDTAAELEEDLPTAAGGEKLQSRSQIADTSFELPNKSEQEEGSLPCSSSSSVSDVRSSTEKSPGSAREDESESEDENAMYLSLNANGDSCDESVSSLLEGYSSSDDELTDPRKCSGSASNATLPGSRALDDKSLQSNSSATVRETSLSADSPRLPRDGDGNVAENWNVNSDSEVKTRGDREAKNNDQRLSEDDDVSQSADRVAGSSDQRPPGDDKDDVVKRGMAIVPSLPQQDQPQEVVCDRAASGLPSKAEASSPTDCLNSEQGAAADSAVSGPPEIAKRSPRKAGNADGCSLEHERRMDRNESDDDFYHLLLGDGDDYHLPVGDEEGSRESRYIEDFYN